MLLRYILIMVVSFLIAKGNVSVFTQEKHTDYICSIAISKDSSLMATIGVDKAIFLWDIKSGYFIKKIDGYSGGNNRDKIVLNKKKNLIITSSLKSRNIIRWNLKKGKKEKILFNNIKYNNDIALSDDGNILFFLNGNILNIYNINKDTLIFSRKISNQINIFKRRIFLNSKNNKIILQLNNTIKMMQFKKNKLLELYSSNDFISLLGFNEIYNLTVSDDFKYIAIAEGAITENSTIAILDLEKMKKIRVFRNISKSLVSSMQVLSSKKELIFRYSSFNKINSQKELEFYSIDTGERVKKISYTGFTNIVPNEKYYIDSLNGLKMKSIETGDTVIDFYPKNNYTNNAIVKNNLIYSLINNNTVKKIDLKDLKIVRGNEENKTYSISSFAYSKFIAYQMKNKIVIINSESHHKIKEIDNPKEDRIQNIFLVDENTLFLGYRRYTLIYDIQLNKIKSYINVPQPSKISKINNDIFISSKNNLYIFNSHIMELKSKKIFRNVSEDEVTFSSSSKGIVALPSIEHILLYDYNRDKNLYGLFCGSKYSNNKILQSSFSKDGSHIAVETSNYTVKIWDIKKRELVKTLKNHTANITSLTYSEDDRYLISSSKDGFTIIYDRKNYQELARFMLFGDEWIMLTPEGYFTGSQKAAKYLLIRTGDLEVSDFRQFYDHFFRPDLVKLKLSGDEKAYQKAIKGMTYQEAIKNPPPKLSFKSIDTKETKSSGFEYKAVETQKEKVKLTFNVKEHDGGGIGLIRIYQEGKLIQTIGEGKVNKQSANVDAILEQERLDSKVQKNQREYIASLSKSVGSDVNLSVEDTIATVTQKTTSNQEGTYTVEIELKSGKNDISIEAFNKTNTVTSYREHITINADIPKQKPKLYAIVAGVNEFEAPNVNNLKYSQNDAKAIKEAVESKMSTLFKDVEVIYLTEKEVTKANILKAAQDISKKAKLNDTVLFYISTHGRAAKGKLYLVPYNNKSVKNWIDFEQTFQAVQSIKALNQIFVIDACESGKANDIVSSVYDSRASVLAKSSGVHMLLATTKGTSAFEHPNPKIKNGVFTYRILQALKDKSIDTNKDKTISILELSKKLKEPQNNTDYQYPVIRNVGKDVGLERVGD